MYTFFEKEMSRVGFIGLGCMGVHMCRNLLRKGVKLAVYDVNPNAISPFIADDVVVGSSPADIAAQCKEILTMLPNGSDVKSVYTQKKGILETLQTDSICMDSSTIDLPSAIFVSELVHNKNAIFLDTPVSGGVVGAEKATLTFMCGGKAEAFHKIKQLLEHMGKNVVHCGKVGSGQAAKICNNMLLGIEMVGVAETMNLGIKLGLDAKTLAGIINTSTGRCWSSDTYNPVPGIIEGIPPSDNYEGGFRVTLINKDLGLAEGCATQVKAPIPMGALAHQIYQMLSNSPQYQSKDFAVIYKFFQQDN